MPIDLSILEDQGVHTISVRGTVDAPAAVALLRALTPLLRRRRTVVVDLAEAESIDTVGIAALAEGLALAKRYRATLRATGMRPEIRQALGRVPAPVPGGVAARGSFLERLGESGIKMGRGAVSFLQLLADTAYWGLIAPFRRHFPPPGASSTQAVRIGVDALPIVCLIAFLLGLIMAFQAAYQLRQFGANIYVANLVGISMVRELGPIMSAIVVAGRSGSAIAAELGTMVVGEEIDALRTMGINENRFLVVPRVYAITFTQPAVTLFANAVGILGGFLIGVLFLDLSASAYLNQTLSALTLGDLTMGLSKSLVFAWIIVLIGCHCGLRITGGAEGVGRATTTSVVASIFCIIVADSIFTTLSTVLG
jgi:phospholipid/cholesterol/gamma-HCH transport system permease protein